MAELFPKMSQEGFAHSKNILRKIYLSSNMHNILLYIQNPAPSRFIR